MRDEVTLGTRASGGAAGGHKADFNRIYAQPDPREYYRVLSEVDYQIPLRALPVVRAVLAASHKNGQPRTVLDVCCSYGVNSALLFSRGDPGQVVARYTSAATARLSPTELAEADWWHYTRHREDPKVLGLDASAPAITYATRAGLLDTGWAENLETAPASAELRAGVRDVGLILCTGGIGYIGPATFEQLLRHVGDPEDLWLLAFVLRMYDYAPVVSLLRAHGLVTQKLAGTFRQRRFVDDDERTAAIGGVRRRGLDPVGKEADGWYHAEGFLTRPARAAGAEQFLATAPRA